jgi:hypothetical protein
MRREIKAQARQGLNFGATMEESGKKGSTAQGFVRRRELLLAAAVLPGLAFAYGPWNAAGPESAPGVLGAMVDHRFSQSLAFAERARSLGIEPYGFAGDISSLWFDRVLPALQGSPKPFVGLTTTGALFCFEQLAWNAGMRVRFRLDHRERDDGLQHFASAQLPAGLHARLVDADRAYGARAADMALGCQAAWSDCTHAVVPATDVMGTQALVTWVIAP